jgi:myo-inositol-1(or 4)-monophosphatase
VRWIIDPLDGTVNYVYGYPMHAVSIGVEVDGVFSVGVVHHTIQPDRSGGQATHSEVVYAAKLGGGATRNGLPISCREPESLQATLLATGFGYDPEQRSAQAKVLVDLLPRVRDIRRSGSCALDLCSVASGVVDAFYETGPNIWDVAAGVVIVSEAGGTWSWDPDRGRILASSRQVWNEFDGAVSTAEEAATHIVQG